MEITEDIFDSNPFVRRGLHKYEVPKRKDILEHIEYIKPILPALIEYVWETRKKQKQYREKFINGKSSNGPVITFGKHKGMPIKDLPDDYVDWIINKSELADNVKEFIKKNRE